MDLGAGVAELGAELRKLLHREADVRNEVNVIGLGDQAGDVVYQMDLFTSHSCVLASSLRLILIPGLIVEEIVQLRK